MLETMRCRIRGLVQFIEKRQRKPIFTDFEDIMGSETDIILPGFSVGIDQAKFVAKARAFLCQHLDHAVVTKLRMNQSLTVSDLAELERFLCESGTGGPENLRRAADDAHGLGLFVRSLVGMDRGAVMNALAHFIGDKTLTANQLEFIKLIINHITEHGFIEPAQLYESPFTDITPRGPEVLFHPQEIDKLLRILETVRATAIVS